MLDTKYKEYHKGLVEFITSNGIEIKSQSNHFLERVFGTIAESCVYFTEYCSVSVNHKAAI